MTWEHVPSIAENGIITEYEIEFNQTTFDLVSMNNVTTVSSSTFDNILSALEEYVNYSVGVRAYTNVGPGPYNDVIYVTTLQDRRFNYSVCYIFIILTIFLRPCTVSC